MSSKFRPNYFIGFKLTDPSLVNSVTAFQEAARLTHPHLTKCFTSPQKLHFTGIVMELKSEQSIAQAINCVNENASNIERLVLEKNHSNDLFVSFGTINTFGKKVLYLDPESDSNLDTLKSIRMLLLDAFRAQLPEIPLQIEDDVWIPHATIMKTSADKKNGHRLKIFKEDFSSFADLFQMKIPVISIDLLSMTEKDSSGYYKSYATISCNKTGKNFPSDSEIL